MNESCPTQKPVWTSSTLKGALPGLPRHFARVIPTYWGSPLSNAQRERLMIAVASVNQCRYCQFAHRQMGRLAGIDEREIQAIEATSALAGTGAERPEGAPRAERPEGDPRAELPEGERLALAYVQDLARRGFTSRDEKLRQDLAAHYTSPQVAAIESAAHVMNFFNRVGNTFDAALAALEPWQ